MAKKKQKQESKPTQQNSSGAGWRGVTQRLEGFKLIYEIDLSQDFGPSSSGKTNIVGTTGGPKPVPDMPGFSGGVNVYMKPHQLPEDLRKKLAAERKRQEKKRKDGTGGA